jgi:hypothetical protein
MFCRISSTMMLPTSLNFSDGEALRGWSGGKIRTIDAIEVGFPFTSTLFSSTWLSGNCTLWEKSSRMPPSCCLSGMSDSTRLVRAQ